MSCFADLDNYYLQVLAIVSKTLSTAMFIHVTLHFPGAQVSRPCLRLDKNG